MYLITLVLWSMQSQVTVELNLLNIQFPKKEIGKSAKMILEVEGSIIGDKKAIPVKGEITTEELPVWTSILDDKEELDVKGKLVFAAERKPFSTLGLRKAKLEGVVRYDSLEINGRNFFEFLNQKETSKAILEVNW